VRAAPQPTSLRQIGIDTITSRLRNVIHRRHIWQRDSDVAYKPEELEESRNTGAKVSNEVKRSEVRYGFTKSDSAPRHCRAAKIFGAVSGLQGQARPTPSPIAKRGGRSFDSSSDTVRAAICCLGFHSNFSIKLSIVQRHWVRILIEGIFVDRI
jgi:hypothetical protein